MIQGHIVPAWNELAIQEEPHDGNLMEDWAFAQQGSVGGRVDFDPIKKEIRYEVTDQEKHAYNQYSTTRSKSDRL